MSGDRDMDPQLNELIKDKSAYGVGGFFDVETTGLSSNTEEIVELSLILFVFEQESGKIIGLLDNYTGYNEPSKKIGKSAQKVHGITDKMVKCHKIDTNRIHSMMDIADFFVAHNASFDRGFLQNYLIFPKSKRWYCTMNEIDWRGKGHSSKGLQNLLDDHGLAPQN